MTGVTAADDHGRWPDRMRDVSNDFSCRDEPQQGDTGWKKYYYFEAGTTTACGIPQKINNESSVRNLSAVFLVGDGRFFCSKRFKKS